MNTSFKNDIDKGLSLTLKNLPSKYFYDKTGDALFVEIMKLPEYYLTSCELDIFQNKTQKLLETFGVQKNAYFELIELGAGDGTKTKELLTVLDNENFNFDYFPIDISENALQGLKEKLKRELPNVSVQIQQGDYFEVLASLKNNKKPKIVLFLGSNIGNMSDDIAAQFIYNLGTNLQTGDKLLIGADLIKSKEIVLPAYNDSKGITAKFNLNLLHRINKELGADFNINKFQHQPEYIEEEGIAKSYVVSTCKQNVHIKALEKSFEFEEGEKTLTEISRKYNDTIINKIIENTDFVVQNKITDEKEYFADYILERQ